MPVAIAVLLISLGLCSHLSPVRHFLVAGQLFHVDSMRSMTILRFLLLRVAFDVGAVPVISFPRQVRYYTDQQRFVHDFVGGTHHDDTDRGHVTCKDCPYHALIFPLYSVLNLPQVLDPFGLRILGMVIVRCYYAPASVASTAGCGACPPTCFSMRVFSTPLFSALLLPSIILFMALYRFSYLRPGVPRSWLL